MAGAGWCAALERRDGLELGLRALEFAAQAVLLRRLRLQAPVELGHAVLLLRGAAVAQRLVLAREREAGVEVADHEVGEGALGGQQGLGRRQGLAEQGAGAGGIAGGMPGHGEDEGVAQALAGRGIREVGAARRFDDLGLLRGAAASQPVEGRKVVGDERAVVGLGHLRRVLAPLHAGPVVDVRAAGREAGERSQQDEAIRPHGRPRAASRTAAGCAGARPGRCR